MIDCLKDVEGRQQEGEPFTNACVFCAILTLQHVVLKVVDNQKEKQDEMMNSVRQGTTDIFKSTDRTLASTRDSINSHAASCRGKVCDLCQDTLTFHPANFHACIVYRTC